MRVARDLPVLITAFAFVLVTAPASAQGKKPSKRDAAIAACVEQITKEIGITSTDPMQRRIAAWGACMKRHGQRP